MRSLPALTSGPDEFALKIMPGSTDARRGGEFLLTGCRFFLGNEEVAVKNPLTLGVISKPIFGVIIESAEGA
jgi:hypothetical protein